MSAKTPFDWFKILTEKTDDDPDLSDWNSFMINRVVSMGKNLVWASDAMNENSSITPKMAFDFYYNTLPKGRVFNKYAKSSKPDETIELLQQVYRISKSEALEYESLLTPEDIQSLKDYLFTGGTEKKAEKKAEKKSKK